MVKKCKKNNEILKKQTKQRVNVLIPFWQTAVWPSEGPWRAPSAPTRPSKTGTRRTDRRRRQK